MSGTGATADHDLTLIDTAATSANSFEHGTNVAPMADIADLVVGTSYGRISGARVEGGVEFRRIPYAAPPLGPRRFRPCQAPTPWDGVRDATGATRSPRDPEDLLYLNIWTPAADDGRRPVMLWVATPVGFHGRAFARDGVVLVTGGYRMGPLAGLYQDDVIEELEGSANLSLLDQVAELEWLRENISNFGGDPDNICVFGESHGGRFTASLAASPRSRHLIRRAIPMSLPRARSQGVEGAAAAARRFFENVALKPGDWEGLGALTRPHVEEAARSAGVGGLVTIDGTVLPADPVEVLASGAAAHVDLMTGNSADEARYTMFPGEGGPRLPANRSDPARVREDIASWFEGTGYSVDDISKVYAAHRPAASEMDVLAAVSTDHFRVLSHRLAAGQRPHNDRVWMYRFSWPSPVRGGVLRSYHWLDTAFVFDMLAERRDDVGEPPPQDVASEYHRAFIRFASTGDPNGGNLPPWPVFDAAAPALMSFHVSPQVLIAPDAEELALWASARL